MDSRREGRALADVCAGMQLGRTEEALLNKHLNLDDNVRCTRQGQGSLGESEHSVERALGSERRAQWLAENTAALESSNAFVAANGLPLTRYRHF